MLTTIDWAGFRTQAEIPVVHQAIREIFHPMGELVSFRRCKGGRNGYQQRVDILMGDMYLGFIAYGGESQLGWVSVDIAGRGCEWCADWVTAAVMLSSLPKFEWRRVDIALTVTDGSVTHERVEAAHAAGMFAQGGRPPGMKKITHADPLAGRTAYIGSRKTAKYLRCYEKGCEMLKDLPTGFRSMVTHIEAIPVMDLYRVEFEWKVKDGGLLPLDVMARRDEYFAGAYPFTASLIEASPQTHSQKRQKGPQRDLELALMQIRQQYGSQLYTALHALGGDVSAVFAKIVGSSHHKKLLAAGVLLVEHD